jgi:hypothetical protein
MARMKSSYKDSFERASRNRGEEFNEPQSNLEYDYAQRNQYDDRSQERAIRRHEMRDEYIEMYDQEQRRNQRAYARTRNPENEFYAGIDPRRKKEIADGGMIREDHMSMANLPRKAIHCEYPHFPYYATPYNDAIIRGADDIRDDNHNDQGRFLNPFDNTIDF